ncbi:uncharacterized protein LOC108211919 [Daucus carota subsp. sativus]|uniref:uncharacterized protein LOC108211919 n=1 Tax=Daucus carota subsp. sativus TaxID=79200 RepID=UPI0007EF440B|nr:PREDICTED: uncharacterized protein LOC108211919 isoform X2 [Daucus carota subsp. sativus]
MEGKEEDYEVEGKKQAAADVLYNYSSFAMTCIGNQVRPCDLRMHLMKEISGMQTSLKESSQKPGSPKAGTASSSGMQLDKNETFRALLA